MTDTEKIMNNTEKNTIHAEKKEIERKETEKKKIFLKDYQQPDYWIDKIDLTVELAPHSTQVTSQTHVVRNTQTSAQTPLVLQGKSLKLLDVKLNGIPPSQYESSEDKLTIFNVPEEFNLLIKTEIDPKNNKSCEGLYQSEDIYCTQCEAEGFRRITYYVDRPDNMAIFSTTLIANKKDCPVLLSNGNLVESKEIDQKRHMARWEDPHKKPSYLFALVAGNLEHIEDRFQTQSSREVTLRIYVQQGRSSKCHHAMKSLKKAMEWDEKRYGLEYDLDIFMIVVVDNFRGAMENKGLNIFNSRCILADPHTATDKDYQRIEAVVAHEYFHNWTGNRVTCRDWFQLSLKEGLTVYRDQEFSSDIGSRPVERIDEVSALRSHQFPEDSGPNAHPVRPTSCYTVSNFYTTTVYEKGAEVIRMIENLVGRNGFRKGMDKYFELFDGQAVTVEDFIHAMEVANQVDLSSQFKNWYHQAGTPEISVSTSYNPNTQEYTLSLQQSCPPTPESLEKKPYLIPIKMGLIDRKGEEMSLNDSGETQTVIELKETQQDFKFNCPTAPVPSLLRDFSSPVKMNLEFEESDLIHLMKYDKNMFNRWEAGQKLYLKKLQQALRLDDLDDVERDLSLDKDFIEAIFANLQESSNDPLFFSRMLCLPSTHYLEQFVNPVDPPQLAKIRKIFINKLGEQLEGEFKKVYQSHHIPGKYHFEDYGHRALKNLTLSYLENTSLPKEQYSSANNMTDSLAALSILNHNSGSIRQWAMKDFYNKWSQDFVVINKWLILQSSSLTQGGLERVQNLMKDPIFDINNPNHISSLIFAFGFYSLDFHRMDGKGYEFYTDQIIDIDHRNPHIAAQLAYNYSKWKNYSPERQALIKPQLERIKDVNRLSKNTFEIINNALQSDRQ